MVTDSLGTRPSEGQRRDRRAHLPLPGGAEAQRVGADRARPHTRRQNSGVTRTPTVAGHRHSHGVSHCTMASNPDDWPEGPEVVAVGWREVACHVGEAWRVTGAPLPLVPLCTWPLRRDAGQASWA